MEPVCRSPCSSACCRSQNFACGPVRQVRLFSTFYSGHDNLRQPSLSNLAQSSALPAAHRTLPVAQAQTHRCRSYACYPRHKCSLHFGSRSPCSSAYCRSQAIACLPVTREAPCMPCMSSMLHRLMAAANAEATPDRTEQKGERHMLLRSQQREHGVRTPYPTLSLG